MEGILLPLFLICSAYGDEPKIVFDNRPETGVPREALAQMRAESNLKGAELEELHAAMAEEDADIPATERTPLIISSKSSTFFLVQFTISILVHSLFPTGWSVPEPSARRPHRWS